MRINLLLISLFIFFNSYSQDKAVTSFRSSIPNDLGKELNLPDPGIGNFNLEQFQNIPGSKNILVIATDSLFRQIFSRYIYTRDSLQNFTGDKNEWKYKMMVAYQKDSLPVIDFSRLDLVLYSACGNCMSLCHHEKGISGCHRAACEFQRAWFLREKTLGRVGEQVIMR